MIMKLSARHEAAHELSLSAQEENQAGDRLRACRAADQVAVAPKEFAAADGVATEVVTRRRLVLGGGAVIT
jgi:hypothetical protein